MRLSARWSLLLSPLRLLLVGPLWPPRFGSSRSAGEVRLPLTSGSSKEMCSTGRLQALWRAWLHSFTRRCGSLRAGIPSSLRTCGQLVSSALQEHTHLPERQR